MLKETVNYEDFDGNEATETLYFHMRRSVLIENLHLTQRLDRIAKIFDEPSRDMTPAEIQEVLDLVKELMRLSYGVRSADGKAFDQDPAVWTAFQKTAVYEAYLWQLFAEPDKANRFIFGIMPQDLVAEAKAQAAKTQPSEDLVELAVAVEDTPQVGSALSREQLLELLAKTEAEG